MSDIDIIELKKCRKHIEDLIHDDWQRTPVISVGIPISLSN